MPKKKQEAAPQAAPSKKSAKKSTKAKKSETPANPATASKPKKETTRTNRKHPAVSDETVMTVLADGKLRTKKDLVSACGGDDVAVTKTVNRLRGQGKIVASGNSRNTVYCKAA